MGLRIRRGLLLVALALAATPSLTEGSEQGKRGTDHVSRNDSSENPPLAITTRNQHRISGMLRVPRRVDFTSRMIATTKADLEVKIGEIELEAAADFELGTRTLDGKGHGLTLEEQDALEALSLELERRLDPYGRDLSPNEDLLFRVVSLWAEAPVGLPLDLQVVVAPAAHSVTEAVESAAAATCQEGDWHDPSESNCSKKKCRSDNDGISLLSGGCDCKSYSGAFHDSHKWTWRGRKCRHGCTETLTAGCDRDKHCLGRCGPGCAVIGAGIYSRDCMDHDRCCRVHGSCASPTDVECGDEYREAADDLLFGLPNCIGCLFSGTCGDGACEVSQGEDASSCPDDCAAAACCSPGDCCRDDLPPAECTGLGGTPYPGMSCFDVGALCPSSPGSCPEQLPACGDGNCDPGEDSCNCSDCITCGDGCCGSAEDEVSCPQDCPLACFFTDPTCCLDGVSPEECNANGGTPSAVESCDDAEIVDCELLGRGAAPVMIPHGTSHMEHSPQGQDLAPARRR